MRYDSAATKARLLDAAYDEFVVYGLAGARVDRIAQAARANKQAIYAYFGSKDALFDAVLDTRLRALNDAVPFTPHDIPNYAGELFDHLDQKPGLVRLTQWMSLERNSVSAMESDGRTRKSREIADSHGLDLERATDFTLLVLAIVQVWGSTHPDLRNPENGPEDGRRLRHRAIMMTAVAAMSEALLAAEA